MASSALRYVNSAMSVPVAGGYSTNQRRYFTGLFEYLRGSPPETVLEDLEVNVDVSCATCIGKGTFGDVIWARTKAGGQQVAVKVLPHRQYSEEAERIKHEVQSLNDLCDHPNLIQITGVMKCSVPITAVSKEAPFVCIVMDYVQDSLPLSQHIYHISDLQESWKVNSEQQRWIDSFASHVVGSIANALSYMHQRGYVHRDVWAENILVSKAGRVVLCDLGSAERHDLPDNKRAELNIPYMSPSAWQGLKQSPGDDCWALGLVLSEVVTGKLMNQRLSGNTTRPVHTNTWALHELMQETSRRCPSLGRLCERMLQEYLQIDVKDVADQLKSDTSPCPVLPDMNWEASSVSRVSSTHAPSTASETLSQNTSVTEQSTNSHFPMWSNYPDLSYRPVEQPSSPRGITSVLEHMMSFAPVTTLPSPITAMGAASPGFSPGTRVKYLARSNNVWYPGILVGRLAGNTGWLVRLDCGEDKQVDDRDSLRLQKE